MIFRRTNGGVQGGKINNVLFVQAPFDFQCVSCQTGLVSTLTGSVKKQCFPSKLTTVIVALFHPFIRIPGQYMFHELDYN